MGVYSVVRGAEHRQDEPLVCGETLLGAW